MTSTEVNQLLPRIDKDWLAKRIEEHQLLSNLMGRQVNRPLLDYVRASINGEEPKHLSTHRFRYYRSRKTYVRKVSSEEMEKLWVYKEARYETSNACSL